MSRAVKRAFEVVRLVRRSPIPLSLTDIANSLDLALSSTHTVVSALVDEDALIQDPDRTYRVGPALFHLGAGYHRGVPYYSRVWNSVIDLAESEQLTAVVAVVWEDHHLILDVHKAGLPGLEVTMGGRVPLDAGAWGKAFYAWGTESPDILNTYTDASIVDVDEYHTELNWVRDHGYAVDLGEFIRGSGAIASGVTSQSGFEGVIALVGPLTQRTEDSVATSGRRLGELAATTSVAMGDRSRMSVLGQY